MLSDRHTHTKMAQPLAYLSKSSHFPVGLPCGLKDTARKPFFLMLLANLMSDFVSEIKGTKTLVK